MKYFLLSPKEFRYAKKRGWLPASAVKTKKISRVKIWFAIIRGLFGADK